VGKADGKVAKRYARALFELTPVPEIDQVNGALAAFGGAVAESLEFRHALINPGIPLSQRIAAAHDVARAQGGTTQNFLNFIGVLLENGRIEEIGAITAEFAGMVAHLKGILALEIVSAFPLGDGERREIQERIQSDFGSAAALTWVVDPAIVGGLVVKSGDLRLDGSSRGALERARESLIGA